MMCSILWVAGLVVVLSGTAFAEQVVLTPSKDNTLYESPTGSTSNGLGRGMFSGKTAGAAVRRALMAFDVAGNVPAGATITSASLTLTVTKARLPSAHNMTLHEVTTDWGEGGSNAGIDADGQGTAATPGDATWVHAVFPSTNWATIGGDFSADSSAVTAVSGAGSSYTWVSTTETVADVQDWLDNPSTNFGWLLKGNETAASTTRRFGTREHPTAASRPQLTIEFDDTTPTLSTTWGAIKDLYR